MNKALAIMYLYPQAKPLVDFMVSEDENGQRISLWNIDAPEPTEEELQSAWEAYSANETAIAYRAKRAAEYPSIGDQLDALFKAGIFPEDMATKIQAVKDKHPKTSN